MVEIHSKRLPPLSDRPVDLRDIGVLRYGCSIHQGTALNMRLKDCIVYPVKYNSGCGREQNFAVLLVRLDRDAPPILDIV